MADGQDPLETLTPGERAAVNRACRRLFNDWEDDGRRWDFVELLREMNGNAAWELKKLRELKT